MRVVFLRDLNTLYRERVSDRVPARVAGHQEVTHVYMFLDG